MSISTSKVLSQSISTSYVKSTSLSISYSNSLSLSYVQSESASTSLVNSIVTRPVEYVDVDNGNSVMTDLADSVSGKIGTSVSYTTKSLPTNYELVGDTVQSITINGTDAYVVSVRHKRQTDTETFVRNAVQQFLNSEGNIESTHSLSPQTVTIVRTTDLVTGKSTYDTPDSTKGENTIDTRIAPDVPGYTISNSENNGAITITWDNNKIGQTITEQTATFTYKPGQHEVVVNAKDAATGATLASRTITGVTNQVIDPVATAKAIVPEGYIAALQADYADDYQLNTEFTSHWANGYRLLAEGNATEFNYYVQQGMVNSTETRTITRTINVTLPGSTMTSTVQSVTFTRTVTVNAVTHESTSATDWTATNTTWPAYTVQTVTGYTPSITTDGTAATDVPAVGVTPETKNSVVNITYEANAESATIEYVDDDNNGSLVGSTIITGSYSTSASTGVTTYVSGLTGYKGLKNAWTQDGTSPSTYTFTDDANQTITVHLKHAITSRITTGDYARGWTVTRADQNGNATESKPYASEKQNATITLNGSVDRVTGAVTKSYTMTMNGQPVSEMPSLGLPTKNAEFIAGQGGTVKEITYGTSDKVTFTDGNYNTNVQANKTTLGWSTLTADQIESYLTDDQLRNIILGTAALNSHGDIYSLYVMPHQFNNTVKFVDKSGNVLGTITDANFYAGNTFMITDPSKYNRHMNVNNDATLAEVQDQNGVTGFYNQNVNLTNAQSELTKLLNSGYKFVSADNGMTVTNGTIQAITQPSGDQTWTITLDADTTTNSTTESFTRNVYIQLGSNTPTLLTTQTVTLTKTTTANAVTGSTETTTWTSGTFDSVDAPTETGYTLASDSPTTADSVTIGGSSTTPTKPADVTFKYKANESVKIIYVDTGLMNGTTSLSGSNSTLSSTSLSGVADGSVATGIQAPSNYVISSVQQDGQDLTNYANYTFKDGTNGDITVYLKHAVKDSKMAVQFKRELIPVTQKVENNQLVNDEHESEALSQTVMGSLNLETDQVTGKNYIVNVDSSTFKSLDELTKDQMPTYAGFQLPEDETLAQMIESGDNKKIAGVTTSDFYAALDGSRIEQVIEDLGGKPGNEIPSSVIKNAADGSSYVGEEISVTIPYVGKEYPETFQFIDSTTNKEITNAVYTNPDGTSETLPSEQTISVQYLHTYGEESNANLTDAIRKYQSLGYTIVKNGYTDNINTRQDMQSHTYQIVLTKSITKDSHTATRTIKVTNVDGTSMVTSQVATVTRSAVWNSATNQYDYGDWNTGTWESVTPAAVTGYTPVILVDGQTQTGGSVKAVTVTNKTLDSNVEISYTPTTYDDTVVIEDQDVKDADGNNKVLDTLTIHGTYNKTINTTEVDDQLNNYEVEGYEVVRNELASSTTQPAVATTYKIILKHKTNTVTDSATPTRTITVNMPVSINGSTSTSQSTVTQTVKFTRTGTEDLVTKDTDWGAWSVATDSPASSWAEYDAPTVAGYTATPASVAAVAVTATTANTTATIDYTANAAKAIIKFIDDDDSSSSVNHSTTIEGSTSTSTSTGISSYLSTLTSSYKTDEAAYDLVGVKENGGTATTTIPDSYTFTSGANQVIEVHLKHHLVNWDKTAQFTRDFNLEYEDTSNTTSKLDSQVANVHLVAKMDNVTGKFTSKSVTMTDTNGNSITEIPAWTPSKDQATLKALGGTVKTDASGNQYGNYNDDTSFDNGNFAKAMTVSDVFNLSDDTLRSQLLRGNTFGLSSSSFTLKVQPHQFNNTAKLVDDSGNVLATVHDDDFDANSDAKMYNVYSMATGTQKQDQNGVTGFYNQYVNLKNVQAELTKLLSEGYEVSDAGGLTISNGTIQAITQPNSEKTWTIMLKKTPVTGETSKAVTRTINVTDPTTGKITTTKQVVNFTRTAYHNNVTGTDVYGAWTADGNDYWDAYTAPTFTGYTPKQATVAKQTVTGDTTDQTVNITYDANAESLTINYVDDDKDGAAVGTATVLTGNTDQTVDTNITAPANYTISKVEQNGTALSSYATYKFLAGSNGDITVHLKHQVVTKDNDVSIYRVFQAYKTTDGKVPSVVDTDDPNIVDGQWGKQTGKLDITYQLDQVTNSTSVISYAWDSGQSITAVDPGTVLSQGPSVDGYELSPDAQTTMVKEQTDHDNFDSNNFGTVSAAQAYKYIVNYGTNITESGAQANIIHYVPYVPYTTKAVTNTITRSIQLHLPSGNIVIVPQEVTFTHNVNFLKGTNTVLNDGKATAWELVSGSAANWPEYTPETVNGYAPNPTTVPEQDVTADMTNTKVDVYYNQTTQHATISFVDDDNNGAAVKLDDGSTSYSLTGVYGDVKSTDISNHIPTNYVLSSTQPDANYGNNWTVGNDDISITVHLKHATKVISSQTKNVIRSIYRQFKDANDKSEKLVNTQTVTFVQNTTEDLVTGNKTTGEWKSDNPVWDAQTATDIPGYTLETDHSSAPKVTVDANTADAKVTFIYDSNSGTLPVQFVDDDNNQAVVLKYDVPVKTGLTVKTGKPATDGAEPTTYYTDEVPTGYTLVPNQNLNATFTWNGTDTISPMVVHLTHGTTTTTTTKALTRKIYVQLGTNTPSLLTSQTTTLTGTTTADATTGTAKSTTWSTGYFLPVDAPTENGYTLASDSPTKAAFTTIGGSTTTPTDPADVIFKYTANAQSINITYVDDDENGAQVGTTSLLNGATDQSVTTNIAAPTNYVISSVKQGETTTDAGTEMTDYATYKFLPSGNKDITVHLKHGTTTNNTSQDFSRNIYIQLGSNAPQLQDIQKVTLTKTTTTDSVTGDVLSTSWSSGTIPAENAPTEDGYVLTSDSPKSASAVPLGGSSTTPTNAADVTFKYQVASGTTYVSVARAFAPYKTTDGTIPEHLQTSDPSYLTSQSWGVQRATVKVNYSLNTTTGSYSIVSLAWADSGNTLSSRDANTVLSQAPSVDGYVMRPGEAQTLQSNYDAAKAAAPSDVNTYAQDVFGDVPLNEVEAFLKFYGWKTTGTAASPQVTDPMITAIPYIPTSHVATKTVPKNVTETINYQYEDGTTASPSVTKTVTFNKTVTYDPTVTSSEKIWSESDWDAASKTFDDVTSPEIAGYTADQTTVTGATVTPTSTNITKTVTYKANACSLTIKYVDDDDGGKELTSNSTVLQGSTGKTVDTNIAAPAGYVLSSVKQGDNTLTNYSTYKFLASGNQDITVHLTHHWSDSEVPLNFNRAFTGYVTKADGTTSTLAQSDFNAASQTATGTVKLKVDDVNAWNVKYEGYDMGSITDIDPVDTTKFPKVTGYNCDDWISTTQQNDKNGTGLYSILLGKIPASVVKAEIEKQIATNVAVHNAAAQFNLISSWTVKYVPNTYNDPVQFIDQDSNNKILLTQTLQNVQYGASLNGTTTAQVTEKLQTLENQGYELVSNELASGPTQPAENHIYKIVLKHAHTSVTPDTPGVTGASSAVVRTINVNTPIKTSTGSMSTSLSTVTQTVDFTRTGTQDKVTKAITWDPWTVKSGETSKWDEYDVPTVTGYTPSQASVAETAVTGDTKAVTVNINYSPVQQNATLEIVDADDGNKVLGTTTINGGTSTTMSKENLNNNYQTTLQKIDHYENLSIDAASQTELNKGYTFSADSNQTVKVLVHHKTTTLHPTQQSARRVYNSLEGQTGSTLQVNQPYKFHYDETYDLFTNKAIKDTNFVYDTKIGSVTAKAYDGYTVTNPDAAQALTLEQLVTVKDGLANNKQPDDVTFKYVLNSYTNSYEFVDADGTAIHAVLAGKPTKYTKSVDLTDVNKVIDDLVASGYKVTSNPLTSGITQVLNGQTYTIKFGHQTTNSTENSTVTLTVHYTGAGDKTPADSVEDVNISRTHTVDSVTKKDVSVTAWTPAKSTYNTVYNPVVSGYVITNVDNSGSTDGGKTVSGVAVGDTSKTITVTYSAVGKYVPTVQPQGMNMVAAEQFLGITNPVDHSWSYTNDPTDPTKVLASPSAPTIDGYTLESTMPTTITNPTGDTMVNYTRNNITDKVIYMLNGAQYSTGTFTVPYLTNLKSNSYIYENGISNNAPSGFAVETVDTTAIPSDGLQRTQSLTFTATLGPLSATASVAASAYSARATTNQTNSSVE